MPQAMGAPSYLPQWLRVGSGVGIFFIAASVILPRLFRKADELEAKGTPHDPLPPHETPPPHLYMVPVPTPTKGSALKKVLERRWKSLHEDVLTKEQAAILVAQSAISTNYGNDMLSFNPIMSRASRFYLHPWTIMKVPEWRHHRPMYRWAPIKVYPSLDAGVFAWLKHLGPQAVKAIRETNPAEYAKAVQVQGEAEHAEEIYEPELVAIQKRLLTPAAKRVPLPVVAPTTTLPGA